MPVEHRPVLFPTMLSENAGRIPEGTLLIDPGQEELPLEGRFRPEALPLSPAEIRAAVRELTAFGGHFRGAGEMAFYGVAGLDDFYAGTTFAIRDEIAARQAEAGRGPDRAQRIRAQLALALAWNAEEQGRDLERLSGGLDENWLKLSRTLGQGADDIPGAAPRQQSIEPRPLPWKPVLEALLTLLPSKTPLLTTDGDVREEMEEFGVSFLPASTAELSEAGLSQESETLLATAPGWRLLCLRRTRPGAPWLDAPRRLFWSGSKG